MKEKRTALILIASALVLAAGAFLMLNRGDDQSADVRSEVTQPAEEPAKAPDWVDKGQEAKPDYAPATAQPEDVTPPPPAAGPGARLPDHRDHRGQHGQVHLRGVPVRLPVATVPAARGQRQARFPGLGRGPEQVLRP